MFDPTRRLLEEIAAAIDDQAPAKLRTADELARWAQRHEEQSYLLADDEGRRVSLSPAQIRAGGTGCGEEKARRVRR